MSANDLVNLRWQYIRAVEANQLLQDEIISLKSMLRNREAQDSITKSENGKKNKRIKIMMGEMAKKLISIKSDLLSTKKNYVAEMGLTNSDFVKLRTLTKKIDNLNFSSTKRHYSEIDALNTKLAEAEKIAKSKIDKAAGDSSKTQNELHELRDQFAKLSSDYQSKIREMTTLQNQKVEAEERLENSRMKITQLQKSLKKLQEENSLMSNISQQEFDSKCRDYEHHIANLNHSNMSLEDEVTKLQYEVERLKEMLHRAPKKSEFSKYVEVKMQNATLQAQVQDLSGRIERKQTVKKNKEKEEDANSPNQNQKRRNSRSTSNNSDDNGNNEKILVPRSRPLSSLCRDSSGENDDPSSESHGIDQTLAGDRLKPYPPETPAPRRTIIDQVEKRSRPSQYRTELNVKPDEVPNQTNSFLARSNDSFDIGVPLVSKATRENLKARTSMLK